MEIKMEMPDFKLVAAELKSVAPITKEAARLYRNHFEDSFDNQGFTDSMLEPWEGRKVPDYGGQRDILIKSGALVDSLRVRIKDNQGEFTIYSNLPYAKLHNEGGKVRVSNKMRKFFWAMYYQHRKARRNIQAEYFKGLALTKRKTLTVKKRQFMGRSSFIDAQIQAKLDKWIRKALDKQK